MVLSGTVLRVSETLPSENVVLELFLPLKQEHLSLVVTLVYGVVCSPPLTVPSRQLEREKITGMPLLPDFSPVVL